MSELSEGKENTCENGEFGREGWASWTVRILVTYSCERYLLNGNQSESKVDRNVKRLERNNFKLVDLVVPRLWNLIALERRYSLSDGFWQSFVTIASCNHLMRIISTYVGNTKKSEISWRWQLFKLGDNQLWGVKRTLSYFLLVANKKTIHLPTSRIVISFR